MIDLHILNHEPSTRPDWWQECLASAKAAESSGTCVLHVVDGVGDSIGANRADAFRLGDQRFVAWLDNDDVLVPEAIPAMMKVFADRPEVCCVYSDHSQIDATGRTLFTRHRGPWTPEFQLRHDDFPHMLAIYRREIVMPCLDVVASFADYSEFVLSGLAIKSGVFAHCPVVAYKRRENNYYVNYRRRIDPVQTGRALSIVAPIILDRMKNGW